MQVVHESEKTKQGQHLAVVKETVMEDGLPSAVWGVAIDSSTTKGVILVCSSLTAAGNLFTVLDEAMGSGEITGIKEG